LKKQIYDKLLTINTDYEKQKIEEGQRAALAAIEKLKQQKI
jgi:hypothetical protein